MQTVSLNNHLPYRIYADTLFSYAVLSIYQQNVIAGDTYLVTKLQES